ncbi:spinster family MFS transporter [Kordiimonas sp. UBA4487]|jgi:MFS family permease|nr:MFS transporter [Kordiimonas sp. UBA4487]
MQGPSDERDAGYPPPLKAWTAVAILSLTYMFSFMDRQILVLLIEPIKADLEITDTEVSLLTGFSFAVVYTLMGVPMGRVADLWVRKYVIIFGVAVWGLLTAACGLARSFPQLFLARMGVGFGEAALTPVAYAIVADLFPPHRLARAMSVFALGGMAVGAGMSLIFGGLVIGFVTEVGTLTLPIIGDIRTWQAVLIIVGGLTLVMLVPLSLMPEPPRHNADPKKTGSKAAGQSAKKMSGKAGGQPGGEDMSFRSVLKFIGRHKSFYGPFIIGMSVINLYSYGAGAWAPSYFIRVHGWDAASTGVTLGFLYIGPAVLGGLCSGWLSDYIFQKGYKPAPLLLKTVAVASLVVLVPLFIMVPLMPLKLVLLVTVNFAIAVSTVLSPTIIQFATPNRMRAQVSAIYLLVVNLIGLGFGPTAVALITDYVFGDTMAVGWSIMATAIVACGLGALLLYRALVPFSVQLEAVIGDKQGPAGPNPQDSEVEVLSDVPGNALSHIQPVGPANGPSGHASGDGPDSSVQARLPGASPHLPSSKL